jgi:radical S-adenosyl methionine domain-containing protein 2
MRDSYILLDEKLRFLDCSGGKKIPSESILDVGVEKAFEKSGFNKEQFVARGG